MAPQRFDFYQFILGAKEFTDVPYQIIGSELPTVMWVTKMQLFQQIPTIA